MNPGTAVEPTVAFVCRYILCIFPVVGTQLDGQKSDTAAHREHISSCRKHLGELVQRVLHNGSGRGEQHGSLIEENMRYITKIETSRESLKRTTRFC